MFTFKSKHNLQRLFLLPLAVVLAFSAGCRIEQERAGEAPEVDVDVEPGQLPEYDVEGPDVTVETEEQPVTVPEVEITEEERTIEVPRIEVEPPGADPEE